MWVCVAVLYGAILLGRGLMIWNSVEEEYYKYYMTKGQGELTQEKLETFENEKKRYDDIYSMTPEQCGHQQPAGGNTVSVQWVHESI